MVSYSLEKFFSFVPPKVFLFVFFIAESFFLLWCSSLICLCSLLIYIKNNSVTHYHKFRLSYCKVPTILIFMNILYFRNISEKNSDINFYDNPLLRAEFLRNANKRTDVMKLKLNLFTLSLK